MIWIFKMLGWVCSRRGCTLSAYGSGRCLMHGGRR
jgi:hypothetical protein